MFSVQVQSEVGPVGVVTTNNRGLNPEELAELAANRIVSVSDNAPEPIKSQAHAFREQVRVLLIHYFQQAQRSERTNIIAMLERDGHREIAEGIRRF